MRPIFIGGTTSHAGKSWMATAICAWMRKRGLRVAPFKAQNMSNNSYACPGGGEIGRAQVAQAEACGLVPEPDMNPILLKPTSESGSQVILNGKVWRNLSARDYYDHHDYLLGQVTDAYERLAKRFDYIVIEGAGSVAELNLKRRDLVNLALARQLGASGLLVADIDRGGVFAAILGTYCLLEESERQVLRAFAVNRFRGDVSLFADGVQILESRAGRPCLGVFPWARHIEIDAEDGVSLESSAPGSDSKVAILRFPRISNFTDFNTIAPFASWIAEPCDRQFECIILPGTKNTIADLTWMKSAGLDEWVIRQHEGGARVIGVCGGYQILGESIADPDCVESDAGEAAGLGLLPVHTTLRPEKTVRPVTAATAGGLAFEAYEIHMGVTPRHASALPFATLSDGTEEGMRSGRLYGTYLHGALESAAVLTELLGWSVPARPSRQENYTALAEWFDQNQRGFADLYL